VSATAVEVIRTAGLSKNYSSLVAVDHVDLVVGQGEAVVLFGPNGAGKTTLIRILTLGLKPTSGTLRVAGKDPAREGTGIRAEIGLLSHQSFLYDDLSARQNLEFYAAIYGVDDPRGRADELLAALGLRHRADDVLRTFSRGMHQRVALARALVHDPKILFLDEPFTGLDPHAAGRLREMLNDLRAQGRTLFFVTHDLDQGLDLSDRWLILHRGKVAAEGASQATDSAELASIYASRTAPRSPRSARA